jgi:hypothetical protein
MGCSTGERVPINKDQRMEIFSQLLGEIWRLWVSRQIILSYSLVVQNPETELRVNLITLPKMKDAMTRSTIVAICNIAIRTSIRTMGH